MDVAPPGTHGPRLPQPAAQTTHVLDLLRPKQFLNREVKAARSAEIRKLPDVRVGRTSGKVLSTVTFSLPASIHPGKHNPECEPKGTPDRPKARLRNQLEAL